MVRKSVYFIVLFAVLFLGLPQANAQSGESVDTLRNKLYAVQNQIKDAEYAYKYDLADIRKASDGKLVALKKEFHANRACLLDERKSQEKALLGDYKKKKAPLEEQEAQILSTLEPKENNNFADRS